MQIPKGLQEGVWCVIEPTRCVTCVQRSCENESFVNTSAIFWSGVDAFNVNGSLKVDTIKQPIKMNSVGSAFDEHVDHGFVVIGNIKRCSHAGNVCVRVSQTRNRPNEPLCRNLILVFALIWTWLRVSELMVLPRQ